jgi:hypothetical protein
MLIRRPTAFSPCSLSFTTISDFLSIYPQVSARHTNAIYLISGIDGQIIWYPSGKKPDFVMNFNFSRLHDARSWAENSTTMEIPFLDNTWDGQSLSNATANRSSILVIALYLDSSTMKLELLHRYERTDRAYSYARDDAHILGNGNVLGD